MSLTPNDAEEAVRVEYGIGLAHLAAAAHRHLLRLQVRSAAVTNARSQLPKGARASHNGPGVLVSRTYAACPLLQRGTLWRRGLRNGGLCAVCAAHHLMLSTSRCSLFMRAIASLRQADNNAGALAAAAAAAAAGVAGGPSAGVAPPPIR
jgi:hypothetical protein